MEYQLAFSPDLGLSPDEFVTEWNDARERRNIAEVRLAPSTGAPTYDPFLLAGVITVISTVATGVLTNVLSEQIKQLLQKKSVHKKVQVQQLEQPDGSPLLVITIEEE
jgi:hypothetical protein